MISSALPVARPLQARLLRSAADAFGLGWAAPVLHEPEPVGRLRERWGSANGGGPGVHAGGRGEGDPTRVQRQIHWQHNRHLPLAEVRVSPLPLVVCQTGQSCGSSVIVNVIKALS